MSPLKKRAQEQHRSRVWKRKQADQMPQQPTSKLTSARLIKKPGVAPA